jgi:phenylacetate-CoA ligase
MTATSPVTGFTAALAELRFAYERVPFFRAHLDGAGLRASDIRTPADFRRVPLTTKTHYRRHFPAGVLADGTRLADSYVYRSQSSGTTGERLVTAAHTYLLTDRMTTTAQLNPALLAALEVSPQRICRYAAPNCSAVECATPLSTVTDRTLPDGTLVLPVAHDLLATPPAMVDQAIGEMLAYQPNWLYADPAHLAFLVRGLRARDVPPPPADAAVLTYSLCTAPALRQITEYLRPRTAVVNVLSMSEFGWLGAECPAGSLHLNTESFYFELMAGERPAELGEVAELVITSISDELSPHIRYRTGDLYSIVDGECACGTTQPRVLAHGRARDAVVRHGRAPITPLEIDQVVGPAPWLDAYKLRQLDQTVVRLRYVPAKDADPAPAAESLKHRLTELVGSTVEVEPVGYIEAERSGKFLACVSGLGANA